MFVEARLERLANYNRQTLAKLEVQNRRDESARVIAGSMLSSVYFEDSDDDTVPQDFEFFGNVIMAGNGNSNAMPEFHRSLLQNQLFPTIENGEDWLGRFENETLEVMHGLLLKYCLEDLRPDCYYKACIIMLNEGIFLQSYSWLPRILKRCLIIYNKSGRNSISFERFVLALCGVKRNLLSNDLVNAHLKLFKLEMDEDGI